MCTWDHIMGFPFFHLPTFYQAIRFASTGAPSSVHLRGVSQTALRSCFPVAWQNLGADITFVHLEPEQWYEVNADFRVQTKLLHHGDSYGYRFEKDGKVVVYSTDAEHESWSRRRPRRRSRLYRGADLVIFDAMYSLADMITIKLGPLQ